MCGVVSVTLCAWCKGDIGWQFSLALAETLQCNGIICHCCVFIYRDSLMEILFEQDNEEKSVATLILDTLVKVQMEYES